MRKDTITLGKDYWHVGIRARIAGETNRRARWATERATLKAAGFNNEYRAGDEAVARAFAAEIKRKTGLTMDVSKRADLSF